MIEKKENDYRLKGMTAVTQSSPGNVDTSDWFTNISKEAEELKKDPNSIMNRAKNKENWFCVHPFAEAFIELDGVFKPCCLAKKGNKENQLNIATTSIKSWMEDSTAMNGIRREMLDPSKGNKKINEYCIRCIEDEKRYGKSRRTHHMWKESNSPDRWDLIEKSARMFEKSGMWTFDQRIVQVQLKSFGIECNLDCHMCNHDSSSMRIDMMNKHKVYSEKLFGPMKKTLRKIKAVEDNLNRISKKDVIQEILKLCPYLNSIKIIGGEPLIMKQYYELLDAIIESGHAKDIYIKYQTNLTTLTSGKHKFVNYIPHFRQISFTASIDGIGKYAEYLRRRCNWKEMEDNIKLLNQPEYKDKAFIDVNSVVTCFSVLRFYDVIEYCKNNPGIRSAGWLMIEWPRPLRVNNLPKKLKDELIPKYEKWPDIQAALKMPEDPDNDFQDTLNYMLKQDKAYKGTKWENNLFDIFPELKEFYIEK